MIRRRFLKLIGYSAAAATVPLVGIAPAAVDHNPDKGKLYGRLEIKRWTKEGAVVDISITRNRIESKGVSYFPMEDPRHG